LQGKVELTVERERHIASTHPDLLPDYESQLVETVKDPDEVRRSKRFSNARMFCKWFKSIRGGKYIVVVVISDARPIKRHWIITSYITRKLIHGQIEWKKD
jgi:hypothetical protein